MENQNKKRSPGLILAIIGAAIFILIILLILNYYRIISLGDLGKSGRQIIVKVGQENIYQKDLDREFFYYPLSKNSDTEKLLKQKIVKDSITLQAMQVEGLIKLDESVFNSFQKDYLKRTKLIAEAKKMFENRRDRISGNVISIWFYNSRPAVVGYEKGKEIALSKITALQAQVKSKKITIQKAAQEIMDDSSLKEVDVSYRSNAIMSFQKAAKDAITFDPGFDSLIRSLAPGEITDIYLAKDKDKDTGKPVDAVYMFAQVYERTANGNIMDFDQWYAQQEKRYEITYY